MEAIIKNNNRKSEKFDGGQDTLLETYGVYFMTQ